MKTEFQNISPTLPKEGEAIAIDHGDVSIELIQQPKCECGALATHVVMLNIRNAGISTIISEAYCLSCAEVAALRVTSALPKPSAEEAPPAPPFKHFGTVSPQPTWPVTKPEPRPETNPLDPPPNPDNF